MMDTQQNLCKRVRQSADLIMQQAYLISVNQLKLQQFCESLEILEYTSWSECHFDPSQLSLEDILSFIFIVDSLNFCFWPTLGFEYDDLTANLKKQLDQFPKFFSADYLANELTVQALKQRVFENKDFCLLEERTAILKNLGECLISNFEGKYSEFLKAANNSAVRLISLIYQHLEGFRDSFVVTSESGFPSTLENKEIFFLKRAQILTADIYAALSERKEFSTGLFPDIDELTMFPDYRVPQILQALGVLKYQDSLIEKIEQKQEIKAQSFTEAKIRASTIIAVERIKDELAKRNLKYNSIQLDWYLWQKGEKLKDEILTHHRTLTKFY